jgi:hypothetical protein
MSDLAAALSLADHIDFFEGAFPRNVFPNSSK